MRYAELLEMLHRALVYLILLEILLIADQSVSQIANVVSTRHVWIKNVSILVKEHVANMQSVG